MKKFLGIFIVGLIVSGSPIQQRAVRSAVEMFGAGSGPHMLMAQTVTASVSLAWGASTDAVGVTGYLVERCVGVGCSSFTQVASLSGTVLTFQDTGLTSSTSYSYRVRATDAAGNLSAYSNTATAVTLDKTPPTAPGSLTATPN